MGKRRNAPPKNTKDFVIDNSLESNTPLAKQNRIHKRLEHDRSRSYCHTLISRIPCGNSKIKKKLKLFGLLSSAAPVQSGLQGFYLVARPPGPEI